jgi:hypothetical protein
VAEKGSHSEEVPNMARNVCWVRQLYVRSFDCMHLHGLDFMLMCDWAWD